LEFILEQLFLGGRQDHVAVGFGGEILARDFLQASICPTFAEKRIIVINGCLTFDMKGLFLEENRFVLLKSDEFELRGGWESADTARDRWRGENAYRLQRVYHSINRTLEYVRVYTLAQKSLKFDLTRIVLEHERLQPGALTLWKRA
jgi:hypothetical protein